MAHDDTWECRRCLRVDLVTSEDFEYELGCEACNKPMQLVRRQPLALGYTAQTHTPDLPRADDMQRRLRISRSMKRDAGNATRPAGTWRWVMGDVPGPERFRGRVEIEQRGQIVAVLVVDDEGVSVTQTGDQVGVTWRAKNGECLGWFVAGHAWSTVTDD